MITPAPTNGGAVDGAVRVWLQLEGIAVLPRFGAAIYNVAHSYVGPLILAATLLSLGTGLTVALV